MPVVTLTGNVRDRVMSTLELDGQGESILNVGWFNHRKWVLNSNLDLVLYVRIGRRHICLVVGDGVEDGVRSSVSYGEG